MQNNQIKAIPFIQFTSQGFQITQESIDFFQSLNDQQIGIISIVGKYRTGKSYFINKVLLDQNEGFTVDPTINACTKGLWIWPKPLKIKNCENKVILMDTEGFGGINEGNNHDTRIFLFSILLSSLFIYNSMGNIDENALQSLSLVINIAKEIMKNQSHENDEEFIQENFPRFLWIIRDFSLELVDSFGNPITERQYLEKALELFKGNSDAIESKNSIRRMIKYFFKNRDCLTMIRPVKNENDLQYLTQLEDYELRTEFLNQIKRARKIIFDSVSIKKFKGLPINAEQFIQIAKAYVQSVNTGKIPNIELAWEYVRTSQNEKIFQQIFRKIQNIELNKDNYQIYKKQFLDEFKENQFGTYEENFELIQKFEQNFDEIFENQKKKQIEKIKQNLKKEIESYFTKFKQEIKLQNYDLEQTEKLIQQQRILFQQQYCHELNDENIQKILQRNFDIKENEISKILINQEKLQKKEKERELELIYLNEQKEIMKQKQKIELERDHLIEQQQYQNNQQQEIIKELQFSQNENSSLNQQINQLQRENQNLKHKLENFNFEQNEQIKQENLNFKELIENLKLENQNLIFEQQKQNSLNEQKINFIEKEKQNNLKVLQQTEEQLNFLNSQNKELQTQLKNLQTNKKLLDINYYEELMKQVEDYNNMKNQYENIYEEINQEKNALQFENNHLKEQINETKSMNNSILQSIQENIFNLQKNSKIQDENFQKEINDLKKLKEFSQIFQCSKCNKFISNTVFLRHLNNCLSEEEKNNSELNFEQQNNTLEQLEITIGQSMVREQENKRSDQNKNFYTEYIINIKTQKKNWYVSRKFKDFCLLIQELKIQQPYINFPPSCQELDQFINDIWGLIGGRTFSVEGRRKLLQKILRELKQIDQIRKNLIFKTFIGEIGEANLKQNLKNSQKDQDYFLKKLTTNDN